MGRESGILMHLTSLPSPYGIGTMGKSARAFVDFLVDAGQSYWQLLPICPTGYGDSPYQSFSGYAGNPYLIDLDMLCEDGFLTESDCNAFPWGENSERVDFGVMYTSRYSVLRIAYDRFVQAVPEDYAAFCEAESAWLSDYALFMALKDAHSGAAWSQWEWSFKCRKKEALEKAEVDYAKNIGFYKMLQYLFFKQWRSLKAYSNEKGIRIIGDVPIYVSYDSVDVWTAPEQFYLNKELQPIDVAGCPPDAFAADGQLWGNPLFRWDAMKADGYGWWTKRISAMSVLYDMVRIDHFRGFDSYFAIPASDTTAKNGEWRKGPGMDLFNALKANLGELNIIVEDLGYLTPSVLKLVADSGFPGMKLIQFAFDSREAGDYIPYKYPRHCVVYTGTHDNDTAMGWMETAPAEDVEFAKEYLNMTEEEGFNWGLMRCAWASVGDLAIVTMQDILGVGSEGRMNTPSKPSGNWNWRITDGQMAKCDAKRIRHCMKLYGRLNKNEQSAQK